MPKIDAEEEEITYGIRIDRELTKWSKEDQRENLTVELAVTLVYDTGEKAIPTIMRKEINSILTELSRYLANAKMRAGKNKVIQISLEDVPGRPFKTMNTSVGEEVPDVPWTSGPMPEALLPETPPEK